MVVHAHRSEAILGPDLVPVSGVLRVDDSGVIRGIAPHPEPGDEIIDHPDCALIPGGVNVHNHSFQALLRGLGDDLPFLEWRARGLYRYGAHLGPDEVYLGALLAFAEMLRSGTTTVCDFFYVHADGLDNDRAVLRAAKDLGIRCVLARTMYDWDGAPVSFRETIDDAVTRSQQLRSEIADDPLLNLQPAPHSLHGASSPMIEAGVALAKDWHSPCHTHIAEESYQRQEALDQWGIGPVEHLEHQGWLNERSVLVHAIWLEKNELDAIAKAGASIAHCPASNMFLGDGVTPVNAYLNRGVTVGLGTDGGCTNSRHSVYDEARSCSMLAKVDACDGAALSAETAFTLATIGGADLLQLPTGRLEAGYQADFSVIRLDDLSMQPVHNLAKNIVHSMTERAIAEVYVAGRRVVADGHVLHLDAHWLSLELKALAGRWRAAP
ncbi:MAG: S-adenosylhomocysteine deaminase [Myxococcales bacterium]|nr:S-adenosylhomocysteine deaminase [Myxococcales bacterium]